MPQPTANQRRSQLQEIHQRHEKALRGFRDQLIEQCSTTSDEELKRQIGWIFEEAGTSVTQSIQAGERITRRARQMKPAFKPLVVK